MIDRTKALAVLPPLIILARDPMRYWSLTPLGWFPDSEFYRDWGWT
jgi:hypothetical protein